MPIYEYKCRDCHGHFERKQRFDEEPLKECPVCQGKAHRVLHSTPIIFKGSGFYVTDHRSDGGREAITGGNGEQADSKSEEPAASGEIV